MKVIIHRCGPCRAYFQSTGCHQNEFSKKTACVRCTFMHPVVKSSNFGYPVCPKTIFQEIRLVPRLFIIPSVHIKSIFNDSWWFAVDYLWTQDLVQQVFIVFCVITKNTSSDPGHSYKIPFSISGQSPNSAIRVSAIREDILQTTADFSSTGITYKCHHARHKSMSSTKWQTFKIDPTCMSVYFNCSTWQIAINPYYRPSELNQLNQAATWTMKGNCPYWWSRPNQGSVWPILTHLLWAISIIIIIVPPRLTKLVLDNSLLHCGSDVLVHSHFFENVHRLFAKDNPQLS